MASHSRDEEAEEESREEESREEEARDDEAERAMAPKRLRICGEAQVPDAEKEPATHEEKWLIFPRKL